MDAFHEPYAAPGLIMVASQSIVPAKLTMKRSVFEALGAVFVKEKINQFVVDDFGSKMLDRSICDGILQSKSVQKYTA